MKTIIKILLSISIVLLTYLCIMSVMTPIRFEEVKASRETVIVKRLIDIRKAEVEFKDQRGGYTASFDTLIYFIKNAKKKTVLKEGALTEKQLEAGLTEIAAVKIVKKGNYKQEQLFRFAGLKVGSVDEPNSNVGNWE